MKPFRLNRRAFIRGASGLAVGLPWLEAMERSGARAATSQQDQSFAQRFVVVYQPGGTVLERWRPTAGSDGTFALSPILAPLEPVRKHVVVIDNVDMQSAIGEQHQGGLMALLTGTPQIMNENPYPQGPSIDQVVAARISAGKKPIPSLQLGIRWGTGKAFGLLAPRNALNFELTAPYSPIPPRIDPVEIWNSLFRQPQHDELEAAKRLREKKSILDFLDKRYVKLGKRLGTADRIKLEQHL
ncbi:MAG TPA: DUF1552 domain-containing protein, partial [Polyangiales bacterium]|nr:DUF1552 domain-containing protein [Polyangiales bacterium]